MATDDGQRWLAVRPGTRRIDRDAAARGRIRWTGDYWQDVQLVGYPGPIAEMWGPIETARYFTTAERDVAVLCGSRWPVVEWVSVFVNVDPVEAGE